MPVGVRNTLNPAAVPGFAPHHLNPQVARRANTLEGGADGVSITTANSGGLSGYAFDFVDPAITFSATQKHAGALSASNLTSASAPAAQTMQWQGFALVGQPLYYRAYLWVAAVPSANQLIVTWVDTAPTTIMRLIALTTGVIRLQDGSGGTLVSTTATLATNAWNRIEIRCDPRPGGGFTQELYLFNGANLENTIDAANTDHVSSTTAVLGNGTLDQVRWGTTTGAALSYQQYWDDVAVNTDGWLGPSGGAATNPLTLSASAAATVVIVNQTASGRAASVTATAVAVKSAVVARAASVTAAAALTRRAGKTLTASLTATAAQVRLALHVASASVTATATTLRGTAKQLSAAVTATAALTRLVAHLLAASVTTSAVVVKRVGKPLAASATATATQAAIKVFLKTLTASVSTTATLTRQAGKLLAASATVTAVRLAQVGKPLAASVTAAATLTKRSNKALSATVTATASTIRAMPRTLTASVTATASLTKQTLKALASTVTAAAALTRRAGKALNASVSAAASQGRRVGKTLSVALVATVTASKFTARTLTAAVTATATSVVQLLSNLPGGPYLYATTTRVARTAINLLTASGTPSRTTRIDEDTTNPSGTPSRSDGKGEINQ